MTTRVPASERTSQRLRELLNSLGDDEVGSQVIRLGIRKIVKEALEAELRDVVVRDSYERGAEHGRGYRNGTRIGRLKTAEGIVEYGVPQVADREEPFRSKVREQLSGRTEELERLVVEMYACGLSTRDIEDALRDEATGKLLISRSAVSEVTERLWAEYEAFATRDLSEFVLAYLFVDGIAGVCARVSLGKRCCAPGASAPTGGRCFCTWLRERRRTRRAVGASSRISSGEA